jgi:DNA modification methylase
MNDRSKAFAPNLDDLTAEELHIIGLLQRSTYEAVRAETAAPSWRDRFPGSQTWSRGRIYQLALKTGARKTETRILERAAERRARQEETLRELIGTTAKADVVDFLNGLPDDSVQLALTSIPYNVGKKYGDGAGDSMRAVYYHGWIMQVISEVSRILKDGGVFFLQAGQTRDWQERLMPLDVLLYDNLRQAGLTFQSRIVWTLPHGLTPKARLAERYETALVFSKGAPSVFNPTAARKPQKQPGKRAFKGPKKGELSGNPLGAFPTNVWDDIPSVRHNHPERKFGEHPAQFPLGLAKRAVLLWSNPGDLVCDPFSGSGTTHVACIQSGRDFVGADLFYEEIRARRVANAEPDRLSPLPGISEDGTAVWQAEARKVEAKARKT